MQLAVCEGTADILDKLRINFPIGMDMRFPDKRVYSSGPDGLWELTTLRLQVWASHIVRIYHVVLQYHKLTFLSRLRELQPLMHLPIVSIFPNLRGSASQQRREKLPRCQLLPKLPRLSPISHPTKGSTLSAAFLLTSHPHILTLFIHPLVTNQTLPHIQSLPCTAIIPDHTQMPQPLLSPLGPTSTRTLWELDLTLQALRAT